MRRLVYRDWIERARSRVQLTLKLARLIRQHRAANVPILAPGLRTAANGDGDDRKVRATGISLGGWFAAPHTPNMALRLYPRLRLDIGWTSLLRAALMQRAPAAEASARAIASFFAPARTVIGLSVRTLFDAVLRIRRPVPGEAIVMSGINVDGMARIATGHGLRIVAVDVGLDTLAPPPGALLRACSENGASICVVTQLYGSVTPIADAAALRAKGVFVVEDCAQAFAGRFYRGSPDADVSLFSFGPIKRATALGGGVAVVRDSAVAKSIAELLASYPALPPRWFRRRACKLLLMKALSTPVLFGALHRALCWFGRDSDTVIGGALRGFPRGDLLAAIRKQPPPHLLALLARRLQEPHDITARHRSVGYAFELQLGRDCQQHSHWLVPVLFNDPDQARAKLLAQGWDATRGATSLRALDPRACPNAARLMRYVLYVPHPVHLSERQRARLAAAVSACSVTNPLG